MAEYDIFKSIKSTISNPNANKKIKDILGNLIKKLGKEARFKYPVPPAAKVEFLTPEKVKKELDDKKSFGKFEVIDYSGRFTVIPAGYPLTTELVNLLIQLVKLNPKVLYIRQADSEYRELDKNIYPSTEDALKPEEQEKFSSREEFLKNLKIGK